MSSRKATSVAAGAVIFSVGMLLSRILGLLKESFLQQTFGNTSVTGAYKLAFMIPDLFYYLLAGGAMSAVFIPVFSSYLAKGEDKEAHLVGSTISTLLLIAMSVCVAICMIFAPNILHLLPASKDFSPEQFNLTVRLSRILCVMLIFTAQSAHFTGILNSFKHFLTPVIVWNVYALSVLIGIVVFSKVYWPSFTYHFFNWTIHADGGRLGIYGVAISIVLGAFLQAAIQFPVAIKYGFEFKFMLELAHEGVRRIFKLFVPMTVSLSLSQVNILMIPMVVGASFGLVAVNDISNANKIVMLPFSLFAAAIGTAVFPTMAQQAALGEHTNFLTTMNKAVKIVMLMSMPSAVGMIILAEPICMLLYGGRKFGIEGVQATAFVLALFSLSVVGLGVAQVVNRAFYSMHDTLTPTIVNVIMVAANIGLSLWIASASHFKYGSVAVATTITSTISTLILIELLRRRLHGIAGRSLVVMTGKTCLAALLMGVTLYFTARWLAPTIDGNRMLPIFHWHAPYVPGPHDPDQVAKLLHLGIVLRLHLAAQVGFSILAGCLVYAGVLWALRVEELKMVTDRFSGKLRRRTVAV